MTSLVPHRFILGLLKPNHQRFQFALHFELFLLLRLEPKDMESHIAMPPASPAVSSSMTVSIPSS